MAASSNSLAALTEANVEAHDFRLKFAQETLQSFKRDRSRSPRRPDDWDAKAAALLSDIANSRIDSHKGHIKSLEAIVQAKNAYIASLEDRIEKARIDDVIQKANIDALGGVVKGKDARIASLEWSLELKTRTCEIMHEIIDGHCRRINSQAASR